MDSLSTTKILTGINWLLIGVYCVFIICMLLQKANPANDAGGGGSGNRPERNRFFLLLVLAGLNWLPHLWTKIGALLLVVSLLLLIRYISTH